MVVNAQMASRGGHAAFQKHVPSNAKMAVRKLVPLPPMTADATAHADTKDRLVPMLSHVRKIVVKMGRAQDPWRQAIVLVHAHQILLVKSVAMLFLVQILVKMEGQRLVQWPKTTVAAVAHLASRDRTAVKKYRVASVPMAVSRLAACRTATAIALALTDFLGLLVSRSCLAQRAPTRASLLGQLPRGIANAIARSVSVALLARKSYRAR